jgi:hypothetical protein
MGAAVRIEPGLVAATPGQPATATISVRNTGGVVDQFSLDVLGDALAWAKIDPPVVPLFPGAEGTATVTFTAPRSPAVRAGRLPFGIRVQSREDPAGSTVEEGVVEVAPFSEVTAELVPRTSRGSTGATHDLAVDNRGNVPLSAALSAVDADRLLAFDVRPAAINAEPGTAAFSKIRVSPQKRFWRGAAINRPFNVQVALPEGTPPLILDAALLQTPILPPGTLRALIALIGLLIALVLAWALLLKPAIESSAREQAEEVLAAVGITLPPSGGPGSSGGSGGDASASPGTSADASASPGATSDASGAPTAAPTAPGGGAATPTDGRLVAGAAPLVPPAGTDLYLTDLVFSNPDPTASGEIRLERAGQVVFSLRLENFRDLDFHFVTPIVIADGQTLAIVCPTTCAGAALYYSGYAR